MPGDATQLVGQRAEALALVYLTRRDDLVISTPPLDVGVDLWVDLKGKESSGRRAFGVIVKGTIDRVTTEEQATKVLNSLDNRPATGEIGMPICTFLFSAQNDDGFYAWKAEPVVDTNGPKLVPHTKYRCKKLDTDSLETMVRAINKWYNALFRMLARRTIVPQDLGFE
jgi:hypothetical protein